MELQWESWSDCIEFHCGCAMMGGGGGGMVGCSFASETVKSAQVGAYPNFSLRTTRCLPEFQHNNSHL